MKGVMLAGDYSSKQDGKKVLGIYRLDHKDFVEVSGKVYKNNVFVWLKTPEISKPEIKLVKLGNRTTIVHVDYNQKDQHMVAGLPNELKSWKD